MSWIANSPVWASLENVAAASQPGHRKHATMGEAQKVSDLIWWSSTSKIKWEPFVQFVWTIFRCLWLYSNSVEMHLSALIVGSSKLLCWTNSFDMMIIHLNQTSVQLVTHILCTKCVQNTNQNENIQWKISCWYSLTYTEEKCIVQILKDAVSAAISLWFIWPILPHPHHPSNLVIATCRAYSLSLRNWREPQSRRSG